MSLSGISVGAFRGDYEALEQMAHASWRDEYGQVSFPNFYKPAFLRYLFDRIRERDLLIAAYRGDEIVGFLANIPQRFHFQDHDYRAVYSCLLVSSRELLRQGLATALIEEALRLNKKYRYDFALLSLETGHRSTSLIKKMEAAGHPVEKVKSWRVIARILDLKQAAYSEGLKGWEKAAVRLIGGDRRPKGSGPLCLREYRPEDLDACLALIGRVKDAARLVLLWDREDLGRELLCPGVCQTLVYEKEGRVAGFLNFIYHDHLGQTVERWAWVHHVSFPDLTSEERGRFVQDFLRYVQAAGCLGAIEWTKKYYPLKPFYRAHFFPYFRGVSLMAWTFRPGLSLRGIEEVYEIQV